MLTFSLQSGSNGNCIYVEADGVGVLFDAGISGKQAQQRLAHYGRDIRQVAGLIISHDHYDHVRCAGIYQRKFRLPIWMTPGTWRMVARQLGRTDDVRWFQPGQTLEFGPLRVRTLTTAHDAAEPVAFIVEHGPKRLGILTDLGHPFTELREWIGQLDAAYIESNYDPEMLANGPYPPRLQDRIRGRHGHLSNDEAGHLARDGAAGRMQWVAAAHLSEQNNHPDLAVGTLRQITAGRLPVHLAWRYEPSEILHIE